MPAPFRIFLCLMFYLEVSIKLWKIAVALYVKSLKYLFTFTDFLLFLTQQWIHFHRMSLSGDIKLNSGAKQDINQCFWVCCWNLNGVASHNFSKGHCFCFFFLLQKLDIVFYPIYVSISKDLQKTIVLSSGPFMQIFTLTM